MNKLTDYLKRRSTETSTLRGLIILIAGFAGYTLSESDALTLIAAGQIVAGLVGAALPDKAG